MSNPSVQVWTSSGSFCFNLNDISQGGVSFMVPNHLAQYINIGDKVKIKKVGSLSFEQPLIIEILHCSKLGAKSGGMVRFGGQFC